MPFPDLLCLELGRLATMHPSLCVTGFTAKNPAQARASRASRGHKLPKLNLHKSRNNQ